MTMAESRAEAEQLVMRAAARALVQARRGSTPERVRAPLCPEHKLIESCDVARGDVDVALGEGDVRHGRLTTPHCVHVRSLALVEFSSTRNLLENLITVSLRDGVCVRIDTCRQPRLCAWLRLRSDAFECVSTVPRERFVSCKHPTSPMSSPTLGIGKRMREPVEIDDDDNASFIVVPARMASDAMHQHDSFVDA